MRALQHQTRRPVLALALAAVALTTVAACSSSHAGTSASHPASSGSSSGSPSSSAPSNAGFPVTLSGGGSTVTLSRRPTRIVSLSATATEMLFAIGAGSQVVAVDKTSDYPANAPHSSLDAYQLNAEAVAGYRPDLVVESGLTAAQTKQLTALDIPVLDQPAAAGLSQAYQEIDQLGRATGHVTEATAVSDRMASQIAAIVASTPKPRAGATYYYELDQTYYSVTSDTFVGQLLKLLGLTSIADSAKGAAAAGGYPQLTGEYILKANPSYIFLADTKCCGQSATTVGRRPGWSTLGAVKDGRVVGLDDDIASRWGPRVVDLLQTIAAAMRAHPTP